jgi:hypothetical protein
MGDNSVSVLPESVRDLGKKLALYDFSFQKTDDIYDVIYPEGDPSGYSRVSFYARDLPAGLLRILRMEEQARGDLVRYEQFDKRWGKVVYGSKPGSTTIAAAGCGPSSLAIVLEYLMNNGSRSEQVCYGGVTPLETAKYAESHGRAYSFNKKTGKEEPAGTAGDPMIKGLKDNWPEYEGSRVTLHEAIGLLEEGRLVIFLCKHCSGYTKNRPLHRTTDATYGGHYMVLAGVEGTSDFDRVFYVVDPGRNENRAMRFIKQRELEIHTAGFWWVYRKGEPATRVSTMADG